MTAIVSIPVGVIVERSKSASQWVDFHWRPIGVLSGVPEAPPWTKLSDDGERVTFYAGATQVELFRTETANYRDNLSLETPLLWITLRPVDGDPPYELASVTADPAEGEAMTEAGANVVETVAMPKSMQETIAAFVAEHHVEREFVKRKRDRADPEALARRGPKIRETQMNDPENFISRWSRRKRQAADEKTQLDKTATQAVDPASEQDRNLTSQKSVVASPPVPEFDVASLPPIESIEAGTDITAFMREGVPSALRHAALRRAWSADPAIRDFVGLNENYWDAANPGGIAGFGDLHPSTDVKRMVSELFGENAAQASGSESSDTSAAPTAVSRTATGTPAAEPDLNTSDVAHASGTKIAAAQKETSNDPQEQKSVRRHGGALPE